MTPLDEVPAYPLIDGQTLDAAESVLDMDMLDLRLAPFNSRYDERKSFDLRLTTRLEEALIRDQAIKAIQRLRAVHRDGILYTVEEPDASLVQSFLTSEWIHYVGVSATTRAAIARGGPIRYSHDDLIGWAIAWAKWKLHYRKAAWTIPPSHVQRIGADAKIAILGDWGSGMYGAPHCVDVIRAALGGNDIVIHLGDVYYAGTDPEIRQNVLNLWRAYANSPVWRACNGNHEMYTGGGAYFDVLLPQLGQPDGSSAFAMDNDNWLVVGLDSAYTDHRIGNGQLDWLDGLLAARPHHQWILVTHHQPLSAFGERGGDRLLEDLSPVLRDRPPVYWYWGHEHRCVFFDAHPVYGFQGRCAGNSGYPEKRTTHPAHSEVIARRPATATGCKWYETAAGHGIPRGEALDGPNPYISNVGNQYGVHGLIMLELSGRAVRETVYSASGDVLRA